MTWRSRMTCGVLLLIGTQTLALAAVPLTINYQGRVLAPDGTPAPGPVDVTLGVYDSAMGGTRVYEEQHPDTELSDGLFSVLLGAGSERVGTFDANLFAASGRWLELGIDGEVLSPRQPFSSVAYAFHAASTDMIGTLTADALVPRGGGTFTGPFGLSGPNGKVSVLLSHGANPNHGLIAAQNADGAARAIVFVNDKGEGVATTVNSGGQTGTLATSTDSGGLIGVYNAQGDIAGLMSVGQNGGTVLAYNTAGEPVGFMSATSTGGLLATYDAAGTLGTLVSSDSNGGFLSAGRGNTIGAIVAMEASGGSVSVLDRNGNTQAGIEVNASNQGRIFADIKNFIVDHPTRPGVQIVYASLEGPEAAIYCRGTVQLERGSATIALPEHFAALAAPGTLTVQLTPESLASQGLGFQRRDDGTVAVAELHGGAGSYAVHFLIHAVRRGYEDYQPVVASDRPQGRAAAASSSPRSRVLTAAVAADHPAPAPPAPPPAQ